MFVYVLQYEILITFKDCRSYDALIIILSKQRIWGKLILKSPKITRKANFSIGVNVTNTNHSYIRENTFMMIRSSQKNLFLALK